MKAFGSYVSHLEELLVNSVCLSVSRNRQQMIRAALDGQPSLELRNRVPLDRRRRIGAFFTGSRMAQEAIAIAFPKIPSNVLAFDPACGVGDLLVAFANRLTCGPDLGATLSLWATHIAAFDLHAEFVRAAKLRLALAALARHDGAGSFRLPDFDRLFPGVLQGSSFHCKWAYKEASHILINPPFTAVEAPENCSWAKGKVNSAGIFMETCASNSEPGTRIIAILPDVLRSGSRYEGWRRIFSSRVAIERIDLLGRFDAHTDVDVFLVVGHVRRKQDSLPDASWIPLRRANSTQLKDRFDVSVGAVVPFRLTNRGQWHPFIRARNLPSWQPVTEHCASQLPPGIPSHLTGKVSRGREHRRCCAGSVSITLADPKVSVLPIIEDHSKFIEAVAPSALCMKGRTASTKS